MKKDLDVHVAVAIRQYPTLYRDVTYEKSRVKVLDHLFLVIGNGMEWKKGILVEKYPEKRKDDDPYIDQSATFDDDYFTKSIFKMVDVPVGAKLPPLSFQIQQSSLHKWRPYPICAYSQICNIPDDIREDWLRGAREIYEKTLEFWSQDLATVLAAQIADYGDHANQKSVKQLMYDQAVWLEKINGRLLTLESKQVNK